MIMCLPQLTETSKVIRVTPLTMGTKHNLPIMWINVARMATHHEFPADIPMPRIEGRGLHPGTVFLLEHADKDIRNVSRYVMSVCLEHQDVILALPSALEWKEQLLLERAKAEMTKYQFWLYTLVYAEHGSNSFRLYGGPNPRYWHTPVNTRDEETTGYCRLLVAAFNPMFAEANSGLTEDEAAELVEMCLPWTPGSGRYNTNPNPVRAYDHLSPEIAYLHLRFFTAACSRSPNTKLTQLEAREAASIIASTAVHTDEEGAEIFKCGWTWYQLSLEAIKSSATHAYSIDAVMPSIIDFRDDPTYGAKWQVRPQADGRKVRVVDVDSADSPPPLVKPVRHLLHSPRAHNDQLTMAVINRSKYVLTPAEAHIHWAMVFNSIKLSDQHISEKECAERLQGQQVLTSLMTRWQSEIGCRPRAWNDCAASTALDWLQHFCLPTIL
ncbi:hypothetical protein V8E36_006351 [Tilletia maclaganii]